MSPERNWRAGLLLVPGVWFGWAVHNFFGIVPGCVVGAALLTMVVLTMRTSLTVTGDGLADRRAVRTVRVPWPRIAGFRAVGIRERIGQHHGRWRDVVLIERRSSVV